MKLKIFLLLLFMVNISFSTLFAYTNNTKENINHRYLMNHKVNNVVAKEDKEMIAWLITLNNNEITASNEALKKEVQPAVKAYAKLLHNDHTANLKQTLALSHKTGIQPLETDEVMDLKKKGNDMMENLAPLNKNEFQVAFIDDMVKGHTEALQTLDDNFLKNVKNASLKSHLKNTRSHINHHLMKAKKIQASLSKMPS